MRASPQLVTISLGLLLLYCSCSRNIFQRGVYQPPRLGAEHRFEDGLRRQKNPQQLFSKKDRRHMEKIGMLSNFEERASPPVKISAARADSILTGKTDSTNIQRTDSASTTPADTTQKK
ncbi:hypothetical protein [Chitinophaga cymbidii]|uniref:Uncharacterized protein n=1 Tax=Chitinophaga cymbidii TaxID=1096750 RepID=A0A512RKC7_9BACT|nr:hypothetical protein [Chitinophaga cymbidii]GEP96171.1 hypothetical protein CCY01nite_24310 [Chitinophaga cymbidii]